MTAPASDQARRLAEPFDPREVKFKPQLVKGNRALAAAYIDCRVVQDRLDDVVGVEGWQDEYDLLPDGSVACKLKVLLDGQWITKMDVGSPSEQPDGGDRLKAAFSDALKRVAVKFGIGRYLYRQPPQWQDYDPVKKQFIGVPQIQAPPARKAETTKPPSGSTAKKPAGQAMPSDGKELENRLKDYERKLGCKPGELVKFVADEGKKAGFAAEIAKWDGPAIAFAVNAVKRFPAPKKAA